MLRALSIQGPEAAAASFRGMFAFAYWNITNRELILGRDALGIKPLYILRNQDTTGEWSLAFASELRALLESKLLISPKLNPAAVASMIWNGFIVTPETAVVGITPLWPGELLQFDSHGSELSSRRFWRFESPNEFDKIDESALARELEESVRLHLVSDVPLGVFLSGGIDSSVLANLAQKTSEQSVHTFTLAFEEAERNEGVYARRIAQAIGTQHQELVLTQDHFVNHLDAALDSLDQPTFDGLNTYFMSQAVRNAGFKVALVGSGGDELFGGYTSFRDLPPLYRLGRQAKWMPMSIKHHAAGLISGFFQNPDSDFPPQTRWAKLPEMVRCEDDLVELYQIAYALFLPKFQSELLSPLPPTSIIHGLPASFRAELLEETRGRTALEAISVLEQRLFLGERLLRDTDATSMAASIEIRLPLVDQRLLSQINRVPDKARYFPLRKKQLLRKIGLQGLTPDLFNRPKSGFELPYDHWLRSTLGDTIDSMLQDRVTIQNTGLNPDAVLSLWHAYQKGTPGLYWSRVWAIYVLVVWCKKHSLTI
jgi:asparagine synthase (glutamine-hydrolysing)